MYQITLKYNAYLSYLQGRACQQFYMVYASNMSKVRLSTWVTPEAKAHLAEKAKEKKMPQSTLLELSINKIK
jgi:hypothetical protein